MSDECFPKRGLYKHYEIFSDLPKKALEARVPPEYFVRALETSLLSNEDNFSTTNAIFQIPAEKAVLMQQLAPRFDLQVTVVGQPGESVADGKNTWTVFEGYQGVKVAIPQGKTVTEFYDAVDQALAAQNKQ